MWWQLLSAAAGCGCVAMKKSDNVTHAQVKMLAKISASAVRCLNLTFTATRTESYNSDSRWPSINTAGQVIKASMLW